MKQSTKDKIADIGRRFRELLTPKAKRRLAIALSALLIGGAVYLNWLFRAAMRPDTSARRSRSAATLQGDWMPQRTTRQKAWQTILR